MQNLGAWQDLGHEIKLRGYQVPIAQQCRDLIRELAQEKPEGAIPGYHRNIVLFSSTGSGKTILFSDLTARSVRVKGNPVLVVVPLDCLVKQTIKAFQNFLGITPSVLKSGYVYHGESPVVLASLQTLDARAKKEDFNLPIASLVIIDECHIGTEGASMQRIFNHYYESVIIGVTATPERTKRTEGLGKYYAGMVQGPDTQTLINWGQDHYIDHPELPGVTVPTEGLVPFKVYRGKSIIDTSEIKTTGGDFNRGQLKQVCDTDSVADHAVSQWLKFAKKHDGTFRTTLVFCAGIEHSEHVALKFIAAGVRSMAIDGSADNITRENTFARLGSPYSDPTHLDVLTSVDLLATGFDVSEIECLIFLRPTKSRAVYIQQKGRGARVCPRIFKSDCIVLDIAGNSARFGLAEEYSPKCLDEPKPKQEDVEMGTKECPECQCVLRVVESVCSACGYEFPKPDAAEALDALVRVMGKNDRKIFKAYQARLRQAYKGCKFPASAVTATKEYAADRGLEMPATIPPDWAYGAILDKDQSTASDDDRAGYLAYLIFVLWAKFPQVKDKVRAVKKWYDPQFNENLEITEEQIYNFRLTASTTYKHVIGVYLDWDHPDNVYYWTSNKQFQGIMADCCREILNLTFAYQQVPA